MSVLCVNNACEFNERNYCLANDRDCEERITDKCQYESTEGFCLVPVKDCEHRGGLMQCQKEDKL